ncbi:MAG: hypothetical protein A4E19_01935 [Nitrospira sp. SG-bin1]|nr:MAG: hypothetical protein A4E19_01935 [Nitrospira sp. SG-bin1]
MDQPMTDESRRADKIRRFSLVVSLILVVLCNAILLGGLALSGINLDDLVKTPDFFNAKQDVCLRLTWQSVPGTNEPVRLCSEWLNLSDPSGTPHYLQPDMKLKKGLDGQYYVDQGIRADYRLLMLMLFVAAIIIGGVRAKWFLVNRYRLRLESADGRRASPAH